MPNTINVMYMKLSSNNSVSSLKLISLNIEKRSHFDRIIPFLKKERPDIVCLQELCEPDIELFKKELGMEGVFAPMAQCAVPEEYSEPLLWGLGLLSKHPLQNVTRSYYYGAPDRLVSRQSPYDNETINRLLFLATIAKGEKLFTVGTTHSTRTPAGDADERQRRDLATLLNVLEDIPEIVFCGDFNAPRGGEIFSQIAAEYRDCIPPQYSTSIDGALHRKGALQLMVDGLFATPHYDTRNTRLTCGVSDHCAVVSEIYPVR